MKSIDLLKTALGVSENASLQLIEDMKNAPLTAPTPAGGNHPHWVLGHITFIEGGLPKILFGEPNPVQHLAPLFAAGTQPDPQGRGYPPYEELIRTFRDLRARNIKTLEQLGEAGLDKPTVSPPPGLEDLLKTAGDTFLVISMHHMTHRGQVADARRAIGRTPMFTPNMR